MVPPPGNNVARAPDYTNADRQARFAERKRAAGYTPHTFWLRQNELAAVREMIRGMRGL